MRRQPSVEMTQRSQDARYVLRVSTQSRDVDDPTVDYAAVAASKDLLFNEAIEYFEAVAQKLRDMRDRKGAMM